MNYSQASTLTIRQLMHALDIDPDELTEAGIVARQEARQNELFNRIAHRLQKHPFELAAMPADDFVSQVRSETAGKSPSAIQLAECLKRYIAANEGA